MKRLWLTLIGLLALVAVPILRAPLVRAQIVDPNPQTITIVDSGTACVTAPTACATWALDSQTGGLTLSVTGTWTGTLTFEGTNNGSTWVALPAQNVATSAVATTTTASGLFAITNVGIVKVRARATAAVTGTAILTMAKGLGFTGSRAVTSGGVVTAGQLLAPDGTSLLPAYSFASEPTLGFWRSGPGNVRLQGAFTATVSITAQSFTYADAGSIASTTKGGLWQPADGNMAIYNGAFTIGARLKVDALPTVASGFGTSPSITAGSTPLAGSVNVGTGGAATTGLITFGGTAWPSAPFCVATPTLTNVPTRATTISTTQLTLTTSTAWTASDVVNWICISSK